MRGRLCYDGDGDGIIRSLVLLALLLLRIGVVFHVVLVW